MKLHENEGKLALAKNVHSIHRLGLLLWAIQLNLAWFQSDSIFFFALGDGFLLYECLRSSSTRTRAAPYPLHRPLSCELHMVDLVRIYISLIDVDVAIVDSEHICCCSLPRDPDDVLRVGCCFLLQSLHSSGRAWPAGGLQINCKGVVLTWRNHLQIGNHAFMLGHCSCFFWKKRGNISSKKKREAIIMPGHHVSFYFIVGFAWSDNSKRRHLACIESKQIILFC